MRRRVGRSARRGLAVGAIVLAGVGLATGALAAGGAWGPPVTLKGMTSDGSGSGIFPSTLALSCAAKGSCTVAGSGGTSLGASLTSVPYVLDEAGGRWQGGTVASGFDGVSGGFAALSCAAAGNCSAVGSSASSLAPGASMAALVASEVRGRWRAAQDAPGSLFAPGSEASLDAVSCPAVGDCVAVGQYEAGMGIEPLVLTEHDGRWGDASLWPLGASLHAQPSALTSVACSSVGDCTVLGTTWDASGTAEPVAGLESGGTPLPEEVVPGASGVGPQGAVLAMLECAAPGQCTAAGTATYVTSSGFEQTGLVDSEVDGTWGAATRLPGLTTSQAATLELSALGCTAAGSCMVGGSLDGDAVVARESHGAWRAPAAVPGTAGLGTGSAVTLLSCRRAGACDALGTATIANESRPFATLTVDGRWQRASLVPQAKGSSKDSFVPLALSCDAGCTAVLEVLTPSDVRTEARTWQP